MGELGLSGRAIIGALKQARIEFIVALPDATMSDHVLWPLSQDKDFKLVRVCKEDEGVSICAGLTSCGRAPRCSCNTPACSTRSTRSG